MNCVLFTKTLKEILENGKRYLKSQGILSVQKSGNHDHTFTRIKLWSFGRRVSEATFQCQAVKFVKMRIVLVKWWHTSHVLGHHTVQQISWRTTSWAKTREVRSEKRQVLQTAEMSPSRCWYIVLLCFFSHRNVLSVWRDIGYAVSRVWSGIEAVNTWS